MQGAQMLPVKSDYLPYSTKKCLSSYFLLYTLLVTEFGNIKYSEFSSAFAFPLLPILNSYICELSPVASKLPRFHQ